MNGTNGIPAWDIGSSDAPVIMGVSPYLTPYQLWEVKLGFKSHDQNNTAIEKGKYWEPRVRALYELETGLDFPAMNFEDHPLGASLDGYNEENQIVLEIKVPGKEVFDLAKDGVVHEKYIWQLEHQLLVSGAKENHFVCAKTTGKGAFDGAVSEMVTVKYISDPLKRERLLAAEQKFWQHVVDQKSPPLTDRDYLYREDEPTIELYENYRSLHEKIESLNVEYDLLDEKLSEIKQKIIAKYAPHQRVVSGHRDSENHHLSD